MGPFVTPLDGSEHRLKPGFAILAPAGTRHNIINGSSGSMKLYTLYAPPNHRDGVVHATKMDAEADKEHFDGRRPSNSMPERADTSIDPLAACQSLQSYPVWDRPTRWFHWINFVCVVALAAIGTAILFDNELGVTDGGHTRPLRPPAGTKQHNAQHNPLATLRRAGAIAT
jgi:hypothetical protein